MADTQEAIITSQMIKEANTKKEIFLGTCLFVAMNYALSLGGFVLVNLLAALDHTDSSSFRDLCTKVVLGSAISINIAIFLYLILKRPRMSIGILAVIPALVLLCCTVILILLLFFVVGYGLVFIIWILMILVAYVLPWVLLGCAVMFVIWLFISFMIWLFIAGIIIVLLVVRNVREKARQKGG